jgi:excisionase family DNA binding protein
MVRIMQQRDHDQRINENFSDPRALGLVRVAYSVNETLDLLSIGRTKVYELVDRGDLKITKLGRKSLVYAIDLAELLIELRARSSATTKKAPQ